MAQTEEQSPPRTILVDGGTGPTLSYELPPGVAIDVQSVYAEIDATGAGDTIAQLTVQEQSGVVIAGKSQTKPIPAADAGSATWALRLADDGDDAATAHSVAAQITRDGGALAATVASGSLNATTTFMVHNTVVYQHGITADVVSVPSRLVVVTDGLYLVNVGAAWVDVTAADYGNIIGTAAVATPVNTPLQTSRRIPSQVMTQQATVILDLLAGATITQVLGQNSGVAKAMPIGFLSAVRLGARP